MFDEFNSHVLDWLAQLPRSHERHRDERDMGDWFVTLCKMDEDKAEIEQLKAVLNQKALAQPEPPAPPVVADSAPGGVSWTLTKPQQFQGYSKPLYDLLKAAHIAGQPLPTARDVLEVWRKKAPLEVAQVLADSLDCYDAKGNTKAVNLEAIRKAIGRMTS